MESESEQPKPQQEERTSERLVSEERLGYVAVLSSTLLEGDIYQRVKNDPEAVAGIVQDLTLLGAQKEEIDSILAMFNLVPKDKND